MIVILSTHTDAHVRAVTNILDEIGAPYRLIDNGSNSDFELAWDERGRVALRIGSETVEPSRIWNRNKIKPPLNIGDEAAADSYFSGSEWRAAMDQIAYCFSDICSNRAQSKASLALKTHQYALAADCGFATPPGAITTSKPAALGLAETGLLITKPIGPPFVPTRASAQGATAEPVMTAPVDSGRLEAASHEAFRATPTLLQRRIDKVREWRVVAVGERILAYYTDPDAKAYTRLDWRRGGAAVRFSAAPEAAARFTGTLRFLWSAELDYGVFDFVEDRQGHLWFLECNPDGQWLFLDHDGALTRTFANFLSV